MLGMLLLLTVWMMGLGEDITSIKHMHHILQTEVMARYTPWQQRAQQLLRGFLRYSRIHQRLARRRARFTAKQLSTALRCLDFAFVMIAMLASAAGHSNDGGGESTVKRIIEAALEPLQRFWLILDSTRFCHPKIDDRIGVRIEMFDSL
ncbi:hypothetical protein F4604DRAFT_1685083 [Suillus subluteus]|nr:hypothetical protein F4604DRAFT_1685083 [Suillus subluteus]